MCFLTRLLWSYGNVAATCRLQIQTHIAISELHSDSICFVNPLCAITHNEAYICVLLSSPFMFAAFDFSTRSFIMAYSSKYYSIILNFLSLKNELEENVGRLSTIYLTGLNMSFTWLLDKVLQSLRKESLGKSIKLLWEILICLGRKHMAKNWMSLQIVNKSLWNIMPLSTFSGGYFCWN